MSSPDDFLDEMFGFSVGEGTTDALLEGRVEPDEAPPGLQEVATLVLAARSLHANGGLAGENSIVAAFVESVRPRRATVAPVSPRPRRSAGRFSAKVAGTAAVLALGGAAAAAATGSLPAPVQAAVSRNLSHVGIDVPDPQTGTNSSGLASSAAAGPGGQGRSTALTAPGTTANEYGLCTAYFAPGGPSSTDTTGKSDLSSVAFSRLEAAAAAANDGTGETLQAFCASIPKPGTISGSDTGSTSTSHTGTPASTPSGKTPGPPVTTPSGKTPGSQTTTPVGTTSSEPSSTNPEGTTTGQPATTPSGNTPGSSNNGNSSTTPAGTAPGLTQITGIGHSGTRTSN